jgi:hypothetical protein
VYAFDAPSDTRSVNEPLQPAASAARPRAARSMRVQFVPLAPAQHHHQLQEDTACALPRNLLCIVSYSLVSAADSLAYPPLVLSSPPPPPSPSFPAAKARYPPIMSAPSVVSARPVGNLRSPPPLRSICHTSIFQLGLMYSAGLFNRTGSCSGSAT